MKLTTLISSLPPSTPFHTYEFFPPRTQPGLQNLIDRIQRLSAAPLNAPLAISVTWGAGGSTAARSLELAQEIVEMQLEGRGGKVEVILHLTCTNMGKRLVDEALKKCKELGIQNVLALRGDPPRKGEYTDPAFADSTDGAEEDDEQEFEYAEDLVRYIRQEYGDWFCVGVAGYPTPHPDSPSPQADIEFLSQKVKAGADFIITQLFYDVDGFLNWVGDVRNAGVNVPIIPGIMPIQNYASFRRLTNLCRCPVPDRLINDLEPIRADDAAVKRYGINLATEMVKTITTSPKAINVPGVHFCTLNLEKSVRTVLENMGWTTTRGGTVNGGQGQSLLSASRPVEGSVPPPQIGQPVSQRNRVIEPDADVASGHHILSTSPAHPGGTLLSISPSEASILAKKEFQHHQEQRRRSTLQGERPPKPVNDGTAQSTIDNAPAPGGVNTGAPTGVNTGGGTEDSWDEYPNGRFTDVRSPAYGEIDGWGSGLKITPAQALKDWGAPVDANDLSNLFCSYLRSSPSTPTTPFCDMPISSESSLILPHLLALNSPTKRWWTVGSQPAVDGARSEDPVHGWGPKGGWVFQKAFVEFFVESEKDVQAIKRKVEEKGKGWVSFYAGNRKGDFVTNMQEIDVNAVTWAVFPGQEIVQSTIIEQVSFLAWKEEAFEIWTEWSRLYPQRSASRKLLEGVAEKGWLVSVVHHDYKRPEALWEFLEE